MTLWLYLHDLGGMRERVRPWIEGLPEAERIPLTHIMHRIK